MKARHKTDPSRSSFLVQQGQRLSARVADSWAVRFGNAVDIENVHRHTVTFLRIRDRSGRLRRFIPNEVQKSYAEQRTARNIILKARQVGITTYIAARFFVSTILQPGTVTLQVAHSLESARRIFRMVHRFAEQLDRDVLPRGIVTERCNVRELAFAPIDSRYIVDTAGNRNAGRGLTIHNLHASEVALWSSHAQETMAALLAAVAPGGNVDIESTPHGTGGYFHREWVRACEGRGQARGGFTPHFFPWWIEPAYRVPLLPGERLEPLHADEQKLMDEHRLSTEQVKFRRQIRATLGTLAAQEYAETDAECFLLSGRPVFDVAVIEERLRALPAPAAVRQNGSEVVWFEPQPARQYVIGADVAEGVERGDFSAAVVVDAQSGLQCAELLARWPVARFAEELARLGQRYNQALLAVERNNHGHAVLHALLHQWTYPRVYRHAQIAASGEASRTPGWPMNVRTKSEAIYLLGEMLREEPHVFASKRLLEQCRAFRYDADNETRAPASSHDDLVIAMAIALAVRAQAGTPQLFSVTA